MQDLSMGNAAVRIFGYPVTLLYGDTAVLDRFLWLRRHLLPGNMRTLDVGCGSGAFAMYASKIGNEVTGISFDKRNNQVARERAKILGLKNVEFVEKRLQELDKVQDLGKFDQIICFETIEHIKNDKKLIQDLSNLLKPGGRLLLTTPYKFYRRLPGDGISDKEDGGHVRWGYTHEEMKELLVKYGLQIEKEEYVTGFVSQQLIRLDRFLSKLDYRLAWALILPLRPFQFLDPLFGHLTSYPYLSIAVVATKT